MAIINLFNYLNYMVKNLRDSELVEKLVNLPEFPEGDFDVLSNDY